MARPGGPAGVRARSALRGAARRLDRSGTLIEAHVSPGGGRRRGAQPHGAGDTRARGERPRRGERERGRPMVAQVLVLRPRVAHGVSGVSAALGQAAHARCGRLAARAATGYEDGGRWRGQGRRGRRAAARGRTEARAGGRLVGGRARARALVRRGARNQLRPPGERGWVTARGLPRQAGSHAVRGPRGAFLGRAAAGARRGARRVGGARARARARACPRLTPRAAPARARGARGAR
jgi:hypothetical protein